MRNVVWTNAVGFLRITTNSSQWNTKLDVGQARPPPHPPCGRPPALTSLGGARRGRPLLLDRGLPPRRLSCLSGHLEWGTLKCGTLNEWLRPQPAHVRRGSDKQPPSPLLGSSLSRFCVLFS